MMLPSCAALMKRGFRHQNACCSKCYPVEMNPCTSELKSRLCARALYLVPASVAP
jgi:hypothetical protein